MHKRHVAVVAVFLLMTLFLTGCGKKSPEAERATEFLKMGEYNTAKTELKILLQKDPKSVKYRGIFLAAMLMSEGGDAFSFYEIYPDLKTANDPAILKLLPTTTQNELKEMFFKFRKKLYDEGLDTSDPDDLLAVIRASADFVFNQMPENKNSHPYRISCAYVLAYDGKGPAIDYLISDLKGSNADHAKRLLLRSGHEAISKLRKIASDPNHLANRTVGQILPLILAPEAAATVFEAYPDIRTPSVEDLPEALQSYKNRSKIMHTDIDLLTRESVMHGYTLLNSPETKNKRLRALLAFSSENNNEGILILSATLPENNKSVSLPFLYKDNKYQALAVTKGGYSGSTLPGETVPVMVEYDEKAKCYNLFFPMVLSPPMSTPGYKLMRAKIEDKTLVIPPDMDHETASLTVPADGTQPADGPESPEPETAAKIPSVSVPLSGGYWGKIAEKYEIEMNLTLAQDNQSVTGSYYYISQKKPIPLTGTLNGNQVVLTEMAGGKVTGKFTGVFISSKISGQWTSADGKKNLSFEVFKGKKPTAEVSTKGKWPFTSERNVTYEDIKGLSKADLRLMRNEIYARHGRAFKSKDLQIYFKKQPWYNIDPGFSNSWLSPLENKNVAFIKQYE